MDGSEEKVVFLPGEKVNLRPLLKSDVGKLMRWINDPEVTQYLSAYLPMHEDEEICWIENLSKRKSSDIVLGVETIERTLIGTAGLHGINWKDRTVTLGISIGEKSYWGKGFGTEAVSLLIGFAFNTLNLRKVCLTVLSNNKRAIKCYKGCGFKVEGCRKRQIFKNGRYLDQILMSVFRKIG
ncbi:MAG: GNAT family N-acetyltransferase [Candidatus Pacebacteria bacterium]|nr:GNAT family N-acetyltransferase [Candidatus Paceibacterota bacterium]NUQ57016.1 GNAT family N-acetyltransferase [Candidatus Paceibacter sp.]